MYQVGYSKTAKKKILKLRKKNMKSFEMVMDKVDEILINPHHYKNLRKPFQKYKRVHVDSSFVLIFSIDEENKIVFIENYDHHDKVYK